MAIQAIRVFRDVLISRAGLASHQASRLQPWMMARACGFLFVFDCREGEAAVWAAPFPAIDSAGLEEVTVTALGSANRLFPEGVLNLAIADSQIWTWPSSQTLGYAGFEVNHQIRTPMRRLPLGIVAVWMVACMDKTPLDF